MLGPTGWVLLAAIVVSGLASAQTTIIPASRGALSMAVAGAFPRRFAAVHPVHGTPAYGTWAVGLAAVAWYVLGSLATQNFLFDSLSALSIVIAFYYALTGLSCAIYWRRELTRSVRAFVLLGLGPVVGALVLLGLLVAAVIDLADPSSSSLQTPILGVGAPLAMAAVVFGAGLTLMVAARRTVARDFFSRRGGEHVDPALAAEVFGGRGRPRS